MNSKHQNLERELKELLPKLIITLEIAPVMEDIYERYEQLGISNEQIGEIINKLILEERPDLKDTLENM